MQADDDRAIFQASPDACRSAIGRPILLSKNDVEIPLIETLELLPEPDRSPTEDFVIPEWLERWQQQSP